MDICDLHVHQTHQAGPESYVVLDNQGRVVGKMWLHHGSFTATVAQLPVFGRDFADAHPGSGEPGEDDLPPHHSREFFEGHRIRRFYLNAGLRRIAAALTPRPRIDRP